MPLRITRSVPVPSSSTNFKSFLLLGTAVHSFTFTARKSDFEKVSKSTNSSNSGSISTFEKSMACAAAGAAGASSCCTGASWRCAGAAFSSGFMVGNKITSRMVSELVSIITVRSTPMPMPPVGGRPYSMAVR